MTFHDPRQAKPLREYQNEIKSAEAARRLGLFRLALTHETAASARLEAMAPEMRARALEGAQERKGGTRT